MPVTSIKDGTLNYKGTYWHDIDWDKPIHQMEQCNCCGLPAEDAVMAGHLNSCYYLDKFQNTPAAEAFLIQQIKEALEREKAEEEENSWPAEENYCGGY